MKLLNTPNRTHVVETKNSDDKNNYMSKKKPLAYHNVPIQERKHSYITTVRAATNNNHTYT